MPRRKEGPLIKFKLGDRVIHKPNLYNIGSPNSPNVFRLRRGEVVDIFQRKNKRGARIVHITVKFDDSSATESFVQTRIEHEENRDQVIKDHVEYATTERGYY